MQSDDEDDILLIIDAGRHPNAPRIQRNEKGHCAEHKTLQCPRHSVQTHVAPQYFSDQFLLRNLSASSILTLGFQSPVETFAAVYQHEDQSRMSPYEAGKQE